MENVAYDKTITPLARLVYLELKETPYQSINDLTEKFGYTKRMMYNCINELKKNNLISKTAAGYMVSSPLKNVQMIRTFKL